MKLFARNASLTFSLNILDGESIATIIFALSSIHFFVAFQQNTFFLQFRGFGFRVHYQFFIMEIAHLNYGVNVKVPGPVDFNLKQAQINPEITKHTYNKLTDVNFKKT